ncbi:unnamed protein product [Bathycoccus prasinos]
MSFSSSSSLQRIVCGDEARAICSVPNGNTNNESLFAVACSTTTPAASTKSEVKIFCVDAQTHRLKEKRELAFHVSGRTDKIVDVDCFRCRDDSVVDSGGGVLLIAACTAEGNVSVFRRREGDSKEGEEEKNIIENKEGENEGEQREEEGRRRRPLRKQYSSCKFDPNGDGRVIAMVTSGGASASFYDHENAKQVGAFTTTGGDDDGVVGGNSEEMKRKTTSKGDWSKANRNQFALTRDGDVFVVDSRSSNDTAKPIFSQASAFRDVAFSASEDGRYIVTASEDWLVKTWDLRKNGGAPAKCFAGHEGAVTKARFNPVYESIVMSSSLDGTVKLWRDSDLGRLPDDDDSERRRNKKVNIDENSGGGTNNNSEGVSVELKAYGNLQTTTVGSFSPVVDACWSCNDPWIMAAITLDGTVALDVVPRSEKYRILL